MVTIANIEKELKQRQRLELAGVSNGGLDIGPYAILRIGYDDSECWEILPLWLANLVVSDLHNHDKVRKATAYQRLPKDAPNDIVKSWFKLHLNDFFTVASVVEAA